ncbi:MAG: hypothetical protein GY926_23730 [bacterium]|nr:hypothetical protein [bacterium]
MTSNKHGLSREIPAGVKRQIRQRVGFGCVRDGNILIQYDHFDPEFSECTEHRSDGITLLCGSCHDKKTRRRLTSEMVAASNQSPHCLTHNGPWTSLDWNNDPLEVRIGSNYFIGVGSLLTIYGVDILKVEPPEDERGPFLLSARFFDTDKREAVRITRNHLEARSDSWDVEEIANTISVRSGLGMLSLQITHDPPNQFVVERLQMEYGDHRLWIDSEGSLVVEMTESPMGPHEVTRVRGNHRSMDAIGLHVPAEGGFRVGSTRPSGSPPWGEDAQSNWRQLRDADSLRRG